MKGLSQYKQYWDGSNDTWEAVQLGDKISISFTLDMGLPPVERAIKIKKAYSIIGKRYESEQALEMAATSMHQVGTYNLRSSESLKAKLEKIGVGVCLEKTGSNYAIVNRENNSAVIIEDNDVYREIVKKLISMNRVRKS